MPLHIILLSDTYRLSHSCHVIFSDVLSSPFWRLPPAVSHFPCPPCGTSHVAKEQKIRPKADLSSAFEKIHPRQKSLASSILDPTIFISINISFRLPKQQHLKKRRHKGDSCFHLNHFQVINHHQRRFSFILIPLISR